MRFPGMILGGLLLAHSAGADIAFTMAQKDAMAESSGTTTLSIADGKVKMHETNGDSTMIYDRAAGTFTAVDHARKAYMVLDQKTASAATAQVSEAMKQMEAQLASLPEAQRKMLMEQMKARMPGMSEAMGGGQPAKTTVAWTDETREVAGYKCKVATLTDGSGDVSKACIAKRSAIGISDEDFETMSSMMATLKTIAGPFAENMQMPDLEEIDGVPIASSSRGQKSELVSVSKDSIAASEFAVPEGYQRQSMPGM